MSSLARQLPDSEDTDVVFVAMLTTSRAVDLFLGDLARRSRSESGRSVSSYQRILFRFADTLRPDLDVTEITSDDCRNFLDLCATRKTGNRQTSKGTQATTYAILNSFLKWLYLQQRVKRNPLDHVPRPRRPKPDDLDVVTVGTADVPRLLSACRNWSEKLAVAIPAYMGPRRSAVSKLRLRDYNRDNHMLRFQEKGGKTIWKPIPEDLVRLLEAAIADGAIREPADYLVPSERATVKAERDDRVIWRLVRKVADRAGVDAHVHALRAAFAVFYLENHTGDVEGLKELMGHESIATTQTYLRKLDRQAAMERVRTLSWDAVASTGNIDTSAFPQFAVKRFESSLAVGAGGFEPPSADFLDAVRPVRQPAKERL